LEKTNLNARWVAKIINNQFKAKIIKMSRVESAALSRRPSVKPSEFLEQTESEIFPFQVSGHDLMLRTNDGNVSRFFFLSHSRFTLFRGSTNNEI
jgi:hypothetical protein